MIEEEFLKAIKENPLDTLSKKAYADWLLDNKPRDEIEKRAFAFRWMGTKQVHPYYRDFYWKRGDKDKPTGNKVPDKYAWGFYRSLDVLRLPLKYKGVPEYALLPGGIMHVLAPNAPHKWFPSFEEAVAHLATSLYQIKGWMDV